MFTKCDRQDCGHCKKNQIKKESSETGYKLLNKHGKFYSPLEDPIRPGHYMKFHDVLNSENSLHFDTELPARMVREVRGVGQNVYDLACPLCPKSQLGSKFRGYVHHFFRDANRCKQASNHIP